MACSIYKSVKNVGENCCRSLQIAFQAFRKESIKKLGVMCENVLFCVKMERYETKESSRIQV